MPADDPLAKYEAADDSDPLAKYERGLAATQTPEQKAAAAYMAAIPQMGQFGGEESSPRHPYEGSAMRQGEHGFDLPLVGRIRPFSAIKSAIYVYAPAVARGVADTVGGLLASPVTIPYTLGKMYSRSVMGQPVPHGESWKDLATGLVESLPPVAVQRGAEALARFRGTGDPRDLETATANLTMGGIGIAGLGHAARTRVSPIPKAYGEPWRTPTVEPLPPPPPFRGAPTAVEPAGEGPMPWSLSTGRNAVVGGEPIQIPPSWRTGAVAQPMPAEPVSAAPMPETDIYRMLTRGLPMIEPVETPRLAAARIGELARGRGLVGVETPRPPLVEMPPEIPSASATILGAPTSARGVFGGLSEAGRLEPPPPPIPRGLASLERTMGPRPPPGSPLLPINEIDIARLLGLEGAPPPPPRWSEPIHPPGVPFPESAPSAGAPPPIRPPVAEGFFEEGPVPTVPPAAAPQPPPIRPRWLRVARGIKFLEEEAGGRPPIVPPPAPEQGSRPYLPSDAEARGHPFWSTDPAAGGQATIWTKGMMVPGRPGTPPIQSLLGLTKAQREEVGVKGISGTGVMPRAASARIGAAIATEDQIARLEEGMPRWSQQERYRLSRLAQNQGKPDDLKWVVETPAAKEALARWAQYREEARQRFFPGRSMVPNYLTHVGLRHPGTFEEMYKEMGEGPTSTEINPRLRVAFELRRTGRDVGDIDFVDAQRQYVRLANRKLFMGPAQAEVERVIDFKKPDGSLLYDEYTRNAMRDWFNANAMGRPPAEEIATQRAEPMRSVLSAGQWLNEKLATATGGMVGGAPTQRPLRTVVGLAGDLAAMFLVDPFSLARLHGISDFARNAMELRPMAMPRGLLTRLQLLADPVKAKEYRQLGLINPIWDFSMDDLRNPLAGAAHVVKKAYVLSALLDDASTTGTYDGALKKFIGKGMDAERAKQAALAVTWATTNPRGIVHQPQAMAGAMGELMSQLHRPVNRQVMGDIPRLIQSGSFVKALAALGVVGTVAFLGQSGMHLFPLNHLMPFTSGPAALGISRGPWTSRFDPDNIWKTADRHR